MNYELISRMDWNEQLWLLGDVLSALGDADVELSDASIEAGETIQHLPQQEQMELICGISHIVFGDSQELLSEYSESEWTKEAIETWGEHLEALEDNDCFWILFQSVYATVDGTNLPHRDELDEMAESIEKGALSEPDLKVLARQLAHSISLEYFA